MSPGDELLAFIKAYRAEHGVSPTFREMADAMCLESTNAINDRLSRLERRGLIRRAVGKGTARNVLPIEPATK